MPKRIDRLTDAERAHMDAWADKWIEIGLRVGHTDWDAFGEAAKACYRYAKIPWPGVVVRVSSPLVLALAAPAAAFAIELMKQQQKQPRGAVIGAVRDAVGGAVHDAVIGAVHDAVGGAVDDAVGGAVDGAVLGAVDGAVDGAVRGAVHGAVGGAVDGAVGGAVHDAVRGAVGGAVDDAVDGAVRGAVLETVRRGWASYVGGQLWVGGYWAWGGAWTSFFREICDLELSGDLWDRARAYEATLQSACWWYPHQRFVMVCARPTVIRRELVNPERARGFGSHRLHCADGPAIAWPDGWGLWMWHGVRVTKQIIEAPETLTAEQVVGERNAEVRRVMIERVGFERFLGLTSATRVQADDYGELFCIELADDEPVVLVRVTNSTAEPDGSFKNYVLRVPPAIGSAREAVAWSFDMPSAEYEPAVQT